MTPALVDTPACEPIKTATPQYLTAEQVGELLQVSSRTVQRWALEDASMPALRLGRTVRFPRAEFERWLERSTQGSRKGKAIASK
jgi:excisionase family DNA binding protein